MVFSATYGRGIFDYQLDPDHTGCYPIGDYDGDGVTCDLDCNDHDASIYPGAPDACDCVDKDCDPTTPDEGDADGDGSPTCEDCADMDAAVHPGAKDVCDDGVDQDCDGGDRACDGNTGGNTGDGDDNSGDDADGPYEHAYAGGCNCASAPGGGATTTGLVLLGLLGLVARRRA